MTEGPNIFFWVGIVRVGIVLVSGELSAMGIVRDGNCPGGNRPQWELSVMGIVWVENVRVGIVLDGNFPGGNCSRCELSGCEFTRWESSYNQFFILKDFYLVCLCYVLCLTIYELLKII